MGKRKRQHGDNQSPQPPAKQTKHSEVELEAWAPWTYPVEFWDRLSEISLTREAVEEHNRRNRLQNHTSSPRFELREQASIKDLARFARHGGPDLSDLRGFSSHLSTMGSKRSSSRRASKSIDPASSLPTSATTRTTKTKKSTSYNRNFDLHLTDHKIRPVYSSHKPDLTEVKQALTVARPSLSPSHFSKGAFETFQEANARAKDEDDVLANVMPTILGPQYSDAVARNTVFGNLEPLTDGTIAAPAPDIYYGAHPEELARPVRDELAHHIIPSTTLNKPLGPNLFVEVKGPDGSAAVAMRQVRYDGAVGSRAMHSLQNYGEDKSQYSDEPHTFSSTYIDGTLKLYAHHVTAPADEGCQPEFHMTQIRTFGMTDTRDTFLEGATAFRNIRVLAKRQRDNLIHAANTKYQSELSQNASEAAAIPLSQESDAESPSQDSVALGNAPPSVFASSFTSSCGKHSRQSASPPSHLLDDQKRPRKSSRIAHRKAAK